MPDSLSARRVAHLRDVDHATDPRVWAAALKSHWSIGEDVEGLTAWFAGAQATAVAAALEAVRNTAAVSGVDEWVAADAAAQALSSFTPIKVDVRGPDGICRLCGTPAGTFHLNDCPAYVTRPDWPSLLADHQHGLAVAEGFELDGGE